MKNSKISTIILCDDHPFTLLGLKFILEQAGYLVLSKHTNGIEAYNQILFENPDLIIVDMDMPGLNGIELFESLNKKGNNSKTIMCTGHNDYDLMTKAGAVGVDGFLLKNFDATEILICIKEIEQERKYFSKHLVNQSKIVNKFEINTNLIDKLTNTEKKILKEVGKGKTTNEIASDLFIASKTVEVHRRNIIRKLMLPSYRNALSSWAQSNFNLLQTDYLN